MSHNVLSILADVGLLLGLFFLPILWILYTDRFRRNPSPEQYASLFFVAAIVGAFLFLPAISIVASTALLAIGIAWASARYALSGITYQRSLSPGRLFAGDEADLIVRLNNRKILPLAWLSITDPIQFGSARSSTDLDDFLQFSGGVEVLPSLEHALINRAAIAPFQELKRTYRIKALKRGVYTLGPATIESGDPFGIYKRATSLAGRHEIIVYPRIFKPDEIGLPFQ